MRLLAIDPGTARSAYVGMTDKYEILAKAKVDNAKVLELIMLGGYDALVIECMEPRTLNTGKKQAPPQRIGDETYETCIWIGRFMEAAIRRGMDIHRVYRSEERRQIIPSKRNGLPPLEPPAPKSPDAQIRKALIARFARFDKVNGRGRANSRDTFYGFAADMWNAFAVGVVYLDGINGLFTRKGDT